MMLEALLTLQMEAATNTLLKKRNPHGIISAIARYSVLAKPKEAPCWHSSLGGGPWSSRTKTP
jgi:hypothetical protein